jgi:hypothetical protein
MVAKTKRSGICQCFVTLKDILYMIWNNGHEELIVEQLRSCCASMSEFESSY